jgi:hypothetical protein
MAFHAHSVAHRIDAEPASYSPYWAVALFALSAASWALTIGAVRLLAAVL